MKISMVTSVTLDIFINNEMKFEMKFYFHFH